MLKEAPKEIVDVDIFLRYLRFCKGLSKIYDALILCDARFLPFKRKAFDIVLFAELLEHLDKDSGEKVLAESERVARKRIIITTPQDPLPHTTLNLNIHQEHVSRYTAKELKNSGFTVYGLGLHVWRYILPITLPKIPLKFAYLLIAYKELS